jgi:hypothetical protein
MLVDISKRTREFVDDDRKAAKQAIHSRRGRQLF